ECADSGQREGGRPAQSATNAHPDTRHSPCITSLKYLMRALLQEAVVMRSSSASVLMRELAAPLVGELPPNGPACQWLAECSKLGQPDRVRVLDGSPAEKKDLLKRAVADGVLLRLNQDKLPGCYLHRSHTDDVARTEHCTYICTLSENLAGPTNNWMPPKQA